jgi:RNA polymerase sigma factor (sigma-70 family)
MNVSSPRLVARLTDPTLTAGLSHFVRTRVPDSEVEDIVQATLSDALQAEQHPEEDEDIVRWVYGICRHKVIDWFRRMRREIPRDLEDHEDAAPAESAPTSAMDLMRWARKQLPKGAEHEQTLEWMLREGDGEKLETIAAEANVPAPRVRQRVSRLRRYFKAKWAAQSAALAALLLVGLAIFLALRNRKDEIAPNREPVGPSAPTMQPQLPPSLPALSTEPSSSAAPDLPDAPSATPTATAAPSASSVTPPPLSSSFNNLKTFDSTPPAPKPTAVPTTPSDTKAPRKKGFKPTPLPSPTSALTDSAFSPAPMASAPSAPQPAPLPQQAPVPQNALPK